MDKPQSQAATGDIITDDFAPADVYDVMGKDPRAAESNAYSFAGSVRR